MVKPIAMQSRHSSKEQSLPGVIWPGAVDVRQNCSMTPEWKPIVDKKPLKSKILWLRDIIKQSRHKPQKQMFQYSAKPEYSQQLVQFNLLIWYVGCISSSWKQAVPELKNAINFLAREGQAVLTSL